MVGTALDGAAALGEPVTVIETNSVLLTVMVELEHELDELARGLTLLEVRAATPVSMEVGTGTAPDGRKPVPVGKVALVVSLKP